MFVWHYLDESGEDLGRSHPFDDQPTAEGWMGEAWPDLRERGVEEVVLMDEERHARVYRMALAEDSA
jgi:hypothetical protein